MAVCFAGTFVQRLLRLRPVYPIPRIAPPFPEAKYPCVNGWTAMWAPPKVPNLFYSDCFYTSEVKQGYCGGLGS
jgi:hypothetical protein